MPRKPCYWTRKLELDLVEFVRQREFIWRPSGNTNHHIQQKYKAYAEFAARLGRGFTARSVRDRWVNIRSTFNHNLRRVDKSKIAAKSSTDVYIPCWPLWKPLQFLKESSRKENSYNKYPNEFAEPPAEDLNFKDEHLSLNDDFELGIRQRGHRTDRPRRKNKSINRTNKNTKCKEVLDDILLAMKPLISDTSEQKYWYFGKHVSEQLGGMREMDAECAGRDILKLISEWPLKNEPT